jgi:hypothetical protein
VPHTANGGFLEHRDVVRGFVGGDDFLHVASNKTVILYSSLQLRQSLFLPSAMAVLDAIETIARPLALSV